MIEFMKEYDPYIALFLFSLYVVHQIYWTVIYYKTSDKTEREIIFREKKHGRLALFWLVGLFLIVLLMYLLQMQYS